MSDVYGFIAEKMPQMTKSNHKIAQYILQHPNEVPFYTVAKMAKMTGVSEATVVRFATFLGYSGYPELQQYMQASVQQQLTTVERLKMSLEVYDEEEQGVYEVFQDDMANIQSTMEKLDMDVFRQVVEAIIQAEQVYIVANRSAIALGLFLQYYLDIILGNTQLVQVSDRMVEQVYRMDEKDVVIGISFSRYTTNTIDVLAFARSQGAKTIAITDHLLSPLIPYADLSLTASSQMATFIDSFVAPLSMINAIITFVGKQKQYEFHDRLQQLEKIWSHFAIFYSQR
ncbi:MurR/RpiR family transcriptional regulator [Rubeoparvulum massiliense]|uniref:MurR/RpiR family transcriptional regulator n=1 Tax=Rubeoparvulum massiliense TaxID=1631346 RepID=UPI00065E95D4|nr:MurR/RpiR family transcriptional regulator [Rubeoparvulum massiliense]